MTTDAATRGKANRRKGHDAERHLVRWLRSNGFAGAERAVRTGYRTPERTSADPGDITGTPGIVWSVKDCAREYIGAWMTELDVMAYDPVLPEPFKLLVVKRKGHADPGEWWCWLRYNDLAGLAEDSIGESCFVFPVRMELADAVMLLRAAGFGDALDGSDDPARSRRSADAAGGKRPNTTEPMAQ